MSANTTIAQSLRHVMLTCDPSLHATVMSAITRLARLKRPWLIYRETEYRFCDGSGLMISDDNPVDMHVTYTSQKPLPKPIAPNAKPITRY